MTRSNLPPLLVVCALLSILTACGDDAPPTGSGTTPSASALPRSPAKAPWTRERLASLAGTEISGWKRTVIATLDSAAMVKYDGPPNAAGARAAVTVKLDVCHACEPMDVAAWRKIEWLRAGIPKAVAADPGLVFDVHATKTPDGRPAIGIYTEGIAAGTFAPADWVPTVLQSQLFVNDGVNAIHVDAMAMGALPRTREDLRASFSRADLEKAVAEVYGAFASAL